MDGFKAKGRLCLDWLAYVALRLMVCGISAVSLETCDRICRIIAWFLSDWTTLRRDVTNENLVRVYGPLSESQLSALRCKMWHHLLLMICEVAHAPRKIHRTNYADHFYMPHKRDVVRHVLQPEPVVLVTGHFGNFEVAGHVVGLLGTPTTTIARPLDNRFIDDYLGGFRELSGQRLLPKEGSSVAVQELLEAGGSLALLADQHAGGKGVWVDFFNSPTSCHKALALFVLSSKAPMCVNYTRRLDRPLRFEMGLTGVVDPNAYDGVPAEELPKHLTSVTELTEWYNARLEDAIRLSPEQYWWLHRRWREVPEKVLRRLQKRRDAKRVEPPAAATTEETCSTASPNPKPVETDNSAAA
jgi:KDO2-lipid IV(A) lauroyltransferase